MSEQEEEVLIQRFEDASISDHGQSINTRSLIQSNYICYTKRKKSKEAVIKSLVKISIQKDVFKKKLDYYSVILHNLYV